MFQQRPLNTGMIANTGGLAVMPPLPEADLAFVNTKCCAKGALGQARQHTSGAELASGDQIGGILHEAFLRLENGPQKNRKLSFYSASVIISERIGPEKP